MRALRRLDEPLTRHIGQHTYVLCSSCACCLFSCLPQGSLVRAMRRLDELLRQLAEALRSIGEVSLAARFEEANERLKRDIVFAASLYL